MTMDHLQFTTFTVDGLTFGIEVDRVQEVLRYQVMTRVPLAPAVVSGLINLRGQIVTAIDLRLRLALRPRPPGQLPMNVVLRLDDGPVSLLVDAIGDVLTVTRDAACPLPETLRHLGRELIKEIFKLNDHLLLILNVENVVTSPSGRSGGGEKRSPPGLADASHLQ
jgi:purine-binding chemotaxis protein CheW